ncbi:MAG: F-box protein [Methylomonas sp.]|jgi:hypothetical protein|uniref:F-box protein n=1 Tax=Methylomonas sp. TaxID=418 RepID=UPI0025EBCBD1|nr:F-box protein [Methylomonas sp.]MCK9607802.1 F-box protein [Methylomonas sp.]
MAEIEQPLEYVLQAIFSFVGVKMLMNLRHVCRDWHRIIDEVMRIRSALAVSDQSRSRLPSNQEISICNLRKGAISATINFLAVWLTMVCCYFF